MSTRLNKSAKRNFFPLVRLLTLCLSIAVFGTNSFGKAHHKQYSKTTFELTADSNALPVISSFSNFISSNTNHNSKAPLSSSDETDDNENEEDADDDFAEWKCIFHQVENLRFNNSKTSHQNFLSLAQNREAVALYVLHQAWKTYLS